MSYDNRAPVNRRARIKKLNIEPGRRILVISDIHANIPYFEGVLKLAEFSDQDVLILNGDFLEKGKESLKTLRLLMEMSAKENVHLVCGNCDDWADMYQPDFRDEICDYIIKYIQYKKYSLIWGGKVIFGIGCGMLTFLIRYYGNLPEGVSFSVLIMNILVPLIERATQPRFDKKEERNV